MLRNSSVIRFLLVRVEVVVVDVDVVEIVKSVIMSTSIDDVD